MLADSNSHYDHGFSSLGKIKSKSAIVVGSDRRKKVERLSDGEWRNLEDFPVTIYGYSFANLHEKLYLIGNLFIDLIRVRSLRPQNYIFCGSIQFLTILVSENMNKIKL